MIVRPLGKEDMFMSLSFEQSLKKNAETAIMKTKSIEAIPVVSMDDISVADTIFKYVSPHGIVAGNQYYSFYILDYLMPKIAEVTGETSKATNDALAKAMQKHGVKYQHKFNR